MTKRVLLLSPSIGRGGGIERYVETLEWAFGAAGIECQRIDLHGSGPAAQGRLLIQARKRLRESAAPDRLVVAHPALLPVACALAPGRRGGGISVVCHGTDVWGRRLSLRSSAENYLMSRPGVRVVAVSSFTAGALGRAGAGPAAVLHPGLSDRWFEALVRAPGAVQRREAGIQLVTAFRLADWQEKGLPELLAAVDGLGGPDVQVTVCGHGQPTAELERLVREHPFCRLRCELSNAELARQLAAADLFVLATRTRVGRRPYGEGFGLVLAEAQVAGTPVVAPAHGGSHDAYIDGMTGVTPADESAAALAVVLERLLRNPDRLAQLSRQAADWARQRFAPDEYAARAVACLL
jgi:phosphatidylinositol alpha-1,6-mannosyltransferase